MFVDSLLGLLCTRPAMIRIEGDRIVEVGQAWRVADGGIVAATVLEHVGFVMKGGVSYRDELVRPPAGR